MIRTARMEDVKDIHTLINDFAGNGLLLDRSISSLYDNLRDFVVLPTRTGRSSGSVPCRSAGKIWPRSDPWRSVRGCQGRGIGAQLVRSLSARGRKIRHRADLHPDLSARILSASWASTHIDKKELPHKIWSDCIHCHKFPDCDEDALMYVKKLHV